MLRGPSCTNLLFLLYIDMVSLDSGLDLLKHTTKEFSVNHFLNQQLVLGIDINREFLQAALFLWFFSWLVWTSYLNTQCKPGSLNLPLTISHCPYFVLSGAQTLLSKCITALTWAGLEFRADKSCSIVIVKGRSMNTTPFSVSKASDQPDVSSWIPSIHSRPIKFLGRIIDGSISDRNSSAELTDKLLAGLSVIDKSHFTGMQKLWILQHLLIPRIQWPLLIYEIPISLAFKLEQKVSVFIRKWLHLCQSKAYHQH